MRDRRPAAILAFVLLALAQATAQGACQIEQFAELPVTMTGLRPIVAAKINGVNANFLLDSGASYSLISPASAEQLGLSLRRAPANLNLQGVVWGHNKIAVTTIDDLSLGKHSVRHVEFIVGGSEPGAGAVGLIGQNLLKVDDIEYDLANGVVRLMHAGEGCDKTVLAYWSKDQPYSVIEIDRQEKFHTVGTAFLNGVQIRVLFDTGAAVSVLSLAAAERAGAKPGGPGVMEAGSSHGIGQDSVATWIAGFASFKIGNEEIHNARLRFAKYDLDLMNADMLLGADFFLSHHLYVANSRDKLYFTYSGGPVFNLAQSAALPNGAVSPAGDVAGTEETSAAPSDAAGFARRGVARAARRDFVRAIEDLTRACELAPNEAAYFYQRGLARWGNHQAELAMADLDQALQLDPDVADAHLKRAQLRVAAGAPSAALQDLDAAAGLVAKQADMRLDIARTYVRADQLAAAIGQYDLWIASHELDANQASALNGRCWARALLGSELDKALADCNAALDGHADSWATLDSRGLVYLRLGNFAKSVADYDAALARQPKIAWALYGRGLNKLRKGMTAEGNADLAAAVALKPSIADEAARHGLAP